MPKGLNIKLNLIQEDNEKLRFIRLFAGILVVVLMSGCAQEARYTASANASNTNTTKASPTPSPTIDPAVQKDRDRQKSIDEQLLGQIIEDFGFSAKDLGVTQEDLDTIIVE